MADVLALGIQALDLDFCMFKQAKHLISYVFTQIKRMENSPAKAENPEKWKLLRQLCIVNESLYLAVNLQKSYENMIEKTPIGTFFDKCEKFKDDEIEELDLPIRLARNQAELQQLHHKLSGYKSFVDEPSLLSIFDAIQAFVDTMPIFFSY